MTAGRTARRAGLVHALDRVIELWALAGGVLLCLIVLLTAYSLVADILFGTPLPGDFEIVEMGVAVAVFAFLPYCQLTDANVSADIFTARARPAVVAFFVFIGAAVAFAFSVFLLWRMTYGMLDLREYGEVTMVNQIPVWYAFVPILVSLLLLAVAAILTMARASRGEIHAGGPSLVSE